MLPNELKNYIQDAELDLEMEELEYIRDRVWLIDRVADDYYDLFEFTYYNTIYTGQIGSLKIIAEINMTRNEIVDILANMTILL